MVESSYDYCGREDIIDCGESLVKIIDRLSVLACQKHVVMRFVGNDHAVNLQIINPFYIVEEKQQILFDQLCKFLEDI